MRILYIDIDSCRPDHLGCYGYHRDTSPAMDAVARDGLVCRNTYTSDAPCLPSRTAFYSGRFGIRSGVVGHGHTAAEPRRFGLQRGFRDPFGEQGLASQLQAAGLHTAMVSPFGQRHSAHWFYAGFHEIHNTGMNGNESAEHVMPVVRKWLEDRGGGDDWYLHVNFWDPHTPYRVPASYGDPFGDEPLPPHLDDEDLICRHLSKTGPHSAGDLGMYGGGQVEGHPRTVEAIKDKASMRNWIDGYDTAIRYVDDQIRWIVDRLKELGIYEDTAIIISADHGENQGELGIYGEHGTADVATCRIPMIIKWPGGVRGEVDDALHYNVDFAPTLVELMGREPCPIWDGQSYAQTVRSGASDGREDLVISQNCHVCQRSVRWDRWLYMRTYHDGFHLFPREMLFDLAQDPHEQNDIAGSHPEICREGAWRLMRWHDEQMLKMSRTCGDSTDPMWTVIREGGPFHALHEGSRYRQSPLPGYLARLEASGRAEGARKLRARYREFLTGDA
ncbi:MAG: sulfatase [Phycisphaeraceae bacterium]|nr:sulfatase [Phycisphaeraceae bacterium]